MIYIESVEKTNDCVFIIIAVIIPSNIVFNNIEILWAFLQNLEHEWVYRETGQTETGLEKQTNKAERYTNLNYKHFSLMSESIEKNK